MKKRKIKIPLYSGTWTIIMCKKIKDVEVDYGLNATEGFDALMMSNKKGYITAFEVGAFTPGIAAHECTHLVNSIFQYSGVKLDLDNDEH